ncbi:MAG: Holliday junction branch migration protein RuvA [Rickettsiales bacterium]
MIGYLKGTIRSNVDKRVLIDVGGVGYEVTCTEGCAENLPTPGETGEVYVYARLREEEFHLYGFASLEEKSAFMELTKISGVGAKVALSILSAMSPMDIGLAVASENKAAFSRTPGVGPKLAGRLINDLKESKIFLSFAKAESATEMTSLPKRRSETNGFASDFVLRDAVTAIEGLGYDRSVAYAVASKIYGANPSVALESLVAEILKHIGSKR